MTDLNAVGTGSRGQDAFGGDWMQVLSWGNRARVFGTIAFLACLNFVLLKCDLLGDPDTYWHVAVGRWIVENGRWPDVDVFSHTAAGQPWIAKEWFGQIALYGAHRAAGWTGVALLGAVSFAASVAVLAAWLSRGPGASLRSPSTTNPSARTAPRMRRGSRPNWRPPGPMWSPWRAICVC
jgi:hypothetical protein